MCSAPLRIKVATVGEDMHGFVGFESGMWDRMLRVWSPCPACETGAHQPDVVPAWWTIEGGASSRDAGPTSGLAVGFRHGMRYRQNTPDTHESARSRHWVMGPFTWSWSSGRHTFGVDTGGDRIGSSRTRSRRRRARRSSKCIAGATRPRCCGPGTGCPAIGCRSVDRPGPAPKVSEPVLVLS